ncbi:MAG: amidohydrolase [Nocardioidaceae bacterium]
MRDEGLGVEIDRVTKAVDAELISFRRDLHAHPELARHEFRTTAAVVDRLRAAGLAPRVLPSGTGVVCDVIGYAGDAPTIGFRGDIDALPLDDRTTTSYRSMTAGACHACGHDAHTTIVLGTALVLGELAQDGLIEQSTRLIFQPAEEIIPGGALDVVAAGETQGLRHVFAFHCDPRLIVGQVGFRVGPITAGADGLKVTLAGPGGHTARPHLTADLVYALGSLVTELPGAMSRLTDPRAGLSVVWGQIHAGTAPNAIPGTGFAEGTIRCLDAGVWEAAHALVPDLIRSLMSPFGVDVQVDAHTSVPPCVNDASAIDLAKAATRDVMGEAGLVGTDQSLGGEDFAWIASVVPGALLRLGVRGPEVADIGDLHQGSFDIDESAISLGVRVFCRLAAAGSEPGVAAR